MYESHWGLRDKPFRNTPDPRYFFCAPAHEEALARALYAVAEGLGGFLLTGEVGCGKTLALRALLSGLDPARFEAAFVGLPDLPPDGLLRELLRGFGYRPEGWPADGLRRALGDFLALSATRGMAVVVALDEAQSIRRPETWEEIRLLLNHQAEKRFGLTLLLSGQPELRGLLEGQPPLAQRLAMQAHLGPLSTQDAWAYFRHRLDRAGGSADLFEEGAAQMLIKASGGVPRRLNHLADLALFAGYGQRAQRVTAAFAAQALAEVPVWENKP